MFFVSVCIKCSNIMERKVDRIVPFSLELDALHATKEACSGENRKGQVQMK